MLCAPLKVHLHAREVSIKYIVRDMQRMIVQESSDPLMALYRRFSLFASHLYIITYTAQTRRQKLNFYSTFE